MKPYKPSEIIIPDNRQRREFDSKTVSDLFMDINGRRLLQAPVVRETGKGPVLVAGETRIRVIKDIFALGGWFMYDGVKYTDTVPTVTLGELSPIDAMEAELHENILRKDLTWQEHAAALKQLKELRDLQTAQKHDEAAVAGLDTTDFPIKPFTVTDLAKEVTGRGDGQYREAVRRELILAEHMDKPEVAGAKDAKEAWKNLKRLEDDKTHTALAAEVGKTLTADSHSLINEDCLTWMKAYIAEGGVKFNVILTDPPYGMGADEFGDAAGRLNNIDHQYSDSYEDWQRLMQAWCPLSYQIAADQAHAYVFCDIDRFVELRSMMQAAGWQTHRTPIVDYKLEGGRVPWPEHGPRRSWELCLYAVKGKMPVTRIYPDVIPCRADEQLFHGAQKPVSLYHNLLMRSVKPGFRVLDTFCGTGPIFPAAHQHKCIATGIELSPASYGKSVTRLKELKAGDGTLEALL